MNYKQHKPEQFEYNGKWVKNWFSNMVESFITIDGIEYPSVENYYQGQKSLERSAHKLFATLSPSKAKRLGRVIPDIRKDWEEVKYDIMKKALRVKFNIPEWKDKLFATGDEVIIEWNNWRDKIWGVTIDDCEGQNLLGKALMEIREELRT